MKKTIFDRRQISSLVLVLALGLATEIANPVRNSKTFGHIKKTEQTGISNGVN